MARRTRRQFTAEQKREAVELVNRAGNLSEVARDLDISRSLLGRWVKQALVDAIRLRKTMLMCKSFKCPFHHFINKVIWKLILSNLGCQYLIYSEMSCFPSDAFIQPNKTTSFTSYCFLVCMCS